MLSSCLLACFFLDVIYSLMFCLFNSNLYLNCSIRSPPFSGYWGWMGCRHFEKWGLCDKFGSLKAFMSKEYFLPIIFLSFYPTSFEIEVNSLFHFTLHHLIWPHFCPKSLKLKDHRLNILKPWNKNNPPPFKGIPPPPRQFIPVLKKLFNASWAIETHTYLVVSSQEIHSLTCHSTSPRF